MKTFPYTTPSGHTYQPPTDYRSLVSRVMDWQQSIIECWEEEECPPDPFLFPESAKIAWRESVLAGSKNERLREENITLRQQIIEHMEECPLAVEMEGFA